MKMEHIERTYLPPAGSNWALPLYDPMVKLMGAEGVKRTLLSQAALRPDHRVLDVGCGTGTLATQIKQEYGVSEVIGLDPDPKALTRAVGKAVRAGVSVRFDRGYADELPYPDASFDRVFSSFMFHHLREQDRPRALREARRVLSPGGSLHMVDALRPETDSSTWWTRMLRSNPHLKDNASSRVLMLMTEAGFSSAEQVGQTVILFGLVRVAFYKASGSKP
jgi:ubiquinone/menaquinone biosynthesis C-methylase UbiE